jgi:ubiquinone/menaquinone biosynthesis C-methylase UbiE
MNQSEASENLLQTRAYSPREFWEKRSLEFGHTGYKDPVLYSYDQPVRLQAIKILLQKLNIFADKTTRILDAGCGTGDYVREFTERGSSVIGIDIARLPLRKLKERFSANNVDLQLMSIDALGFSDHCFDIVLSITVLQHLISPLVFNNAVKDLIRVTKLDGYLFLLEIAPVTKSNIESLTYLTTRSRKDWIKTFTRKGCRLVYEQALPETGMEILTFLRRLTRLKRPLILLAQIFKPIDLLLIYLHMSGIGGLTRFLIFQRESSEVLQ